MGDNKDLPGGVQRVAAFLLSLDKNVAAKLLKHLGEDVVAEVAEAMTDLHDELAGPEGVESIWRDLAKQVLGPQRLQSRNEPQLAELLRSSIGAQRSDALLAQMRQRRLQERPFLAIENEAPENLARVLSSESPAIAAVVLAHIDPSASAAVLSTFEAENALDIVERMASLTPPGFDTLQAISKDLVARIDEMRAAPTPPDPVRRLKTIADMLNFTKEDIEQSVLEGLAEKDEEVATEIREHMFTWEDVGEIDKRSMQKILSSVDTRTLSMSLKAASPAVENNIMANLSARVRDMVADERELAGAVPMSEVIAARNDIMATVRGLMESGEFRPSRSGEELVS